MLSRAEREPALSEVEGDLGFCSYPSIVPLRANTKVPRFARDDRQFSLRQS
jgi:hypothetical protein